MSILTKKQIKHICGNCMLYDNTKKECKVVILHEGEKHHLPVTPPDECFFEGQFKDKNGDKFLPVEDLKQVRFWVENPDEKGHGKVKIEYPKELDA